jgi:hypothetical protein
MRPMIECAGSFAFSAMSLLGAGGLPFSIPSNGFGYG